MSAEDSEDAVGSESPSVASPPLLLLNVDEGPSESEVQVASDVVVEYEVSISLSDVEVKDIEELSEPLVYRRALLVEESEEDTVELMEEE